MLKLFAVRTIDHKEAVGLFWVSAEKSAARARFPWDWSRYESERNPNANRSFVD